MITTQAAKDALSYGQHNVYTTFSVVSLYMLVLISAFAKQMKPGRKNLARTEVENQLTRREDTRNQDETGTRNTNDK